MKKLTTKDKSKNELTTLLKKAQKELVDLRMQNSMQKLKNPRSVSAKRKEVARILTTLRTKELSE